MFVTALYKVYAICCTGNKAFLKVYWWFYWTSNPQFWERSQSVPGAPKQSCSALHNFSWRPWWKDIIYIAEIEIKGSGKLLFVFLEKLLYEVCLIRIKNNSARRGAQLVPIGMLAVEKHFHQILQICCKSKKSSNLMIYMVSGIRGTFW